MGLTILIPVLRRSSLPRRCATGLTSPGAATAVYNSYCRPYEAGILSRDNLFESQTVSHFVPYRSTLVFCPCFRPSPGTFQSLPSRIEVRVRFTQSSRVLDRFYLWFGSEASSLCEREGYTQIASAQRSLRHQTAWSSLARDGTPNLDNTEGSFIYSCVGLLISLIPKVWYKQLYSREALQPPAV